MFRPKSLDSQPTDSKQVWCVRGGCFDRMRLISQPTDTKRKGQHCNLCIGFTTKNERRQYIFTHTFSQASQDGAVMLAAPIGTVNHTNRPPAPGTYKASKHFQVLCNKEDETPGNKTAYPAPIGTYRALDTRVCLVLTSYDRNTTTPWLGPRPVGAIIQ